MLGVAAPSRKAAARRTVVVVTLMGPAYTVPVEGVGRVPFVVYRMVAPGVVLVRVTLCGVE